MTVTAGLPGLMMPYPLVLTRILERARRVFPHRQLITKTPAGGVERHSFAETYGRICRLAHGLRALGVGPGRRVGTFAWNSQEHLELYFGIPCLGAVIHTLNIRLSPEQLAYVVNQAEDEVVFVDGTLLPLFEKAVPLLKTVRHYVVIGTPPAATALRPLLAYEELLAPGAETFDWPELDENAAAGLCYTSGTTGNPKGVLYSHRSQFLHAMAICMGDSLGVTSADVVLSAVPMFHANAWGLPYAAAFIGAQLVFPGPHLKPADLAGLIQDEGVTLAAGVPTLWQGLYQEMTTKAYDMRRLRALIVGGAAMPRSLIQSFEETFRISVLHAWGMTELSPLGTTSGLLKDRTDLPAEIRYDRKARQGVPAPGVDMRIVDEQGAELPWDGRAVGEVQVRGPWVARAYFRDPSGATQFTADGWFITGDMAAIDGEGSMAITDRAKDLIKSGGEWISSVALENALVAHADVAEAAVIAVPDDKWSERPLAVVVARAGRTPAPAELQKLLAANFPKFWIPEAFRFVAEIPKTSVGKIDKKKLRQLLAAGQL